jgi:DNA polymerase-3 subunit gamma/tau
MAKQKTKPAAEESIAPDRNYTVLARRYRPQQFDQLIGQEHVTQALTNALQTGRVAHAYLFTGARGVGKTSCARILAKALNCVKGPTTTPCDACDVCQAIMTGDDVDVVEIDGASNNSVDDVRELRQNVQFRPSRARFKIYIIDEVHMLSLSAFNALLKTLEEPPAHVKFIFATTNVQKVPITILSRCQRFDFAGISVKNIVAQLRRVVTSEGMKADDAALELVARRAGGSMRDAESLLDQLLALGGHLSADQVHQQLGTANDDRVVALASAVLNQDAPQVLQLLGAAADEGLDLSELLNQLIDYWRDLMIVHCAGVDGQLLSIGTAYQDTLARHARSLSLDTILAGVDVLVAAKTKLKFSSQHGRVLVEAALLRLTQLGNLVSLSQLTHWLSAPASAERRGVSPLVPQGNSAPPPDAPPRKFADRAPAEDAKKKSTVTTEPVDAAPTPLTPATAPQIWSQLISQLTGPLATNLQKIDRIAISAPNTLVISFAAGYNLLRDRCQEKVGQLEHLLQKITGQPCLVRIETTETIHDRPSTDSPQGSLSAGVIARGVEERLSEIPLIKKAREILGAQILERNTDQDFGIVAASETILSQPADQE